MKKISLLVILLATLIVPFAVNADTNSSKNPTSQNDDHEGDGSFSKGLSESNPYVMTGEGSDSFSYINLTGSGETDSFFSVTGRDTPLFSATLTSDNSSTGMAPRLIDVSTNKTIDLNHEGSHYTFGKLVSGDEYDLKVAYTVSPHTSAAVYATVAVAAVPEPEQWGMMIAGLLLVAAKVGKTKKSANTRSSLCV
ncbi:MAG: hypothetical protein WCG16_03315 [Methylococcales bacterium]